jgi:hypothetical protein
MASNPERRLVSGPLGATSIGGRRSGRRRNRPTVAAHRSKPLPVPQSNKLDKVFTYDIMAMRGTRFANLGMIADGGGNWRR